MSIQEQDKSVSQEISDAAEAKTTALSDEDLDNVAGGVTITGVQPACFTVTASGAQSNTFTVKPAGGCK